MKLLLSLFLLLTSVNAVERHDQLPNDEFKAFYNQIEEKKVDEEPVKNKIEPYVEGAVLKEIDKVNQRLLKFWDVSGYQQLLNINLDIDKIKEHDQSFYNSLTYHAKDKKENDLEFIDFYVKKNDTFEEKSLSYLSFIGQTILGMDFRGIAKKIIEWTHLSQNNDIEIFKLVRKSKYPWENGSLFNSFPYAKSILEKDLEGETIFDIAKKERHKLWLEDYKHALEHYSSK